MRALIALVLCGVLLGACGQAASPAVAPTPTVEPTPTLEPIPTPKPACSLTDGRKAVDVLQESAQQWDDANKLASQTPRVSLSPQIAELQKVRRSVQQQGWPDCSERAHVALVNYMDKIIDAYIAFLGQKPEADVSKLFADAKTLLDVFFDETARLRAQ